MVSRTHPTPARHGKAGIITRHTGDLACSAAAERCTSFCGRQGNTSGHRLGGSSTPRAPVYTGRHMAGNTELPVQRWRPRARGHNPRLTFTVAQTTGLGEQTRRTRREHGLAILEWLLTLTGKYSSIVSKHGRKGHEEEMHALPACGRVSNYMFRVNIRFDFCVQNRVVIWHRMDTSRERDGQFYGVFCKDGCPAWQAKHVHWRSSIHIHREATFKLNGALDRPELKVVLSLSQHIHFADMGECRERSLCLTVALQVIRWLYEQWT